MQRCGARGWGVTLCVLREATPGIGRLKHAGFVPTIITGATRSGVLMLWGKREHVAFYITSNRTPLHYWPTKRLFTASTSLAGVGRKPVSQLLRRGRQLNIQLYITICLSQPSNSLFESFPRANFQTSVQHGTFCLSGLR